MQRKLEYIYAVYKTGSFSKAAKYLYASQPAVSMAIQRMEEEVGTMLFDRKTQPLRPTETGRILIRHIERIIESEKTFRNELDLSSGTEEKLLRIGCTPMHAIYLVPEVLSRMYEELSDIRIEVINEFPQGMSRSLRDHKIDVAVNTFSDIEYVDFTFIPAFKVHYLLGVPANFPINKEFRECALTAKDVIEGKHMSKNCPEVPLTAFSDTPYIDFLEGTEFFLQSRKIFSETDFVPNNVKLTISGPAMAHEMSMRGHGATIVGHFSVKEKSPLIYYRLQTKWGKREFFFMTRKDHKMSKVQKLFIDVFQDYMGEWR